MAPGEFRTNPAKYKMQMAEKVSFWIQAKGSAHVLQNTQYTVLNADLRISDYSINIRVPNIPDIDSVHMYSIMAMDSQEKKIIGALDERERLDKMGNLKLFLNKRCGQFGFIYGMLPSMLNWENTRLTAVIRHNDLSKHRFFQAVDGMVTTFEQLKAEYTRIAEAATGNLPRDT